MPLKVGRARRNTARSTTLSAPRTAARCAFPSALRTASRSTFPSALRTAALTVTAIFVSIFATTSNLMPAQARLLEGKVEHAEALPPLEDDLSVGKNFDPKLYAQKARLDFRFYRIPAWLAGKWQMTETVQTSKLDLKRGKIDRHRKESAFQTTDTFGDVIDKGGRIWQFDRAPYSYRTDLGETVLFTRTKSSEPTETAPYQVTINTLMENVKVDKATGKIVASWESENLQTYTPKGEYEIHVQTSQKDFDARGEASQLVEGFAVERRLEEFQPSSDAALKAALSQYLESSHLAR